VADVFVAPICDGGVGGEETVFEGVEGFVVGVGHCQNGEDVCKGFLTH